MSVMGLVNELGSVAVAVLHNEARPFDRTLDLNGIKHRRTKARKPKANGFVERLNGMVLDEFFRVKMLEPFYDTVEALQFDLDAWLVHYKIERPHLRYRIMEIRPIENRTVICQSRRSSESLERKSAPAKLIYFGHFNYIWFILR